MFTGIVEEVGRVRGMDRRAGYQRTVIDARAVLEDARVGDSISIGGSCHTVVDLDGRGFAVESVAETLERTTMGRLRAGGRVNLERSVRVGDRLGGHFVAGHVDGVGRVLERRVSSDNVLFAIEFPGDLAPYVAAKGSIAIDGVSLTVVSAEARTFTVALIPHTLQVTTLLDLRMGDAVNLEVDLVARYLERLLAFGSAPPENGLTEGALRGMGYSNHL